MTNDLDKLLDQMEAGIALESSPELRDALDKAVQARKNDTRTIQQKIADAVKFITDTSCGGP